MRNYLDSSVDGKKECAMLRPLSIAAVFFVLLAFMLVSGCSRGPHAPPSGGAQGSKSDRARKQAENLALNVVNGVAKSQAEAIPELAKNKKTGIGASISTIFRPRETVQVKSSSSTPVATNQTSTVATSVPANTFSPPPQIISTMDPPEPKSPPRPGSPAIIRERVISSRPYQTEAEAEDDVLNVSQNTIEQRLAELDPPVKYRPSLNEIRSEFLRKDSRATTKPGQKEIEIYKSNDLPTNVSYVEYDVEVTADQIRELRTRDRITMAFRFLAGLTFISLSCFLFLRADEWTKGYLTRWLACGAVALVGGATIALFLV